MELSLEYLVKEAKLFCETESQKNHVELLGIDNGKSVGTYIEHKFQEYLKKKYVFTVGSSAKGIDLPDNHINTDIKVTSIKQPQSSCPFRNAEQKIFGLGYNLLVFVYDKIDEDDRCNLNFLYCTFIKANRTSDYTITKRLIEMIGDNANKEDIVGFLQDKNVPGDEIVYNELSDKIIENPPIQGYLTISNALQWRLQYSRAISLNNAVNGIENYSRI